MIFLFLRNCNSLKYRQLFIAIDSAMVYGAYIDFNFHFCSFYQILFLRTGTVHVHFNSAAMNYNSSCADINIIVSSN